MGVSKKGIETTANSSDKPILLKPNTDNTPQDELTELKQNLKVSFSRMKEDIHYNRQQVEDLITVNTALQEQLKLQAEQSIRQQEQIRQLLEQLAGVEKRPKGLKGELMKRLARNSKDMIKQRILSLAESGRYPIAELKEIVVDEKGYCSKASFYRYIEELKKEGKIGMIEIEGRPTIPVARNASRQNAERQDNLTKDKEERFV